MIIKEKFIKFTDIQQIIFIKFKKIYKKIKSMNYNKENY